MLLSPSFALKERDASITKLDRGFVERERKKDGFASVIAAAANWPKHCGVTPGQIATEKFEFERHIKSFKASGKAFERIFVKDAERAFKDPVNQETLEHMLTILSARFGDYAQAMSLVASFLLLFLDVPVVLAMIMEMGTNPKYIPAYWKAQANDVATDGYVLHYLLDQQNKEVGGHLKKQMILPETYVQKWFPALCVHVLPFEPLFNFFSRFCEEGHLFLFRFGLSFHDNLKSVLVKADDQGVLYALLRLDTEHSVIKQIAKDSVEFVNLGNRIVNDPKFLTVDMSGLSKALTPLRKQLFEQHLKKKLEAAARATAAAQEAKAPAEKCAVCKKEGEYWCKECAKVLCETCRDENKGGHDEDAHEVCTLEERDDNEVVDKAKGLAIK